MSHDGKRQVTLEDLLRLKRAERPAAEFWDQFDRELRAKQLAALMKKRPWWRALPRAFSGFTRYQVPLGAAAVLALSFVTVRTFTTPEAVTPERIAPVSRAGTDGRVAAELAPQVERPVSPTPDFVAADEPAAVTDTVIAADVATVSLVAEHTPVIPLLVGAVESAFDDPEASPSARSIAANLAAVHASDGAITAGLLGGARTFEPRAVATRAVAVEPLQQMTPPSEVRLARYRSPLVATIADESEDRTGERIARRISGDRLYDHIGRVGARGDSVSWKF